MKIIQSFILMQNTEKRVWVGGGEICSVLFFKESAISAQYPTLP